MSFFKSQFLFDILDSTVTDVIYIYFASTSLPEVKVDYDILAENLSTIPYNRENSP
jgi:hypothetical protein